MLAAIQLNDKHLLETDKINNELVNGALAAKFIAMNLSSSKTMPEFLFGFSEIFS